MQDQEQSSSFGRLCNRLAARVKLVQGRDQDVSVVLSPVGVRYFQYLDSLQVLDHHGRKFQRLTITELQKETRTLKAVLLELLDAIRASHRYQNVTAIDQLPATVSDVVGRVKALGETTTELSSILAEYRGYSLT
ncbi:hypothetical protein FKP32DRAFT_1677297 [Trametes sanguinea]|nr:hypothetical protein FKP32DRAFT_1677297 [Trametes sanguinea]